MKEEEIYVNFEDFKKVFLKCVKAFFQDEENRRLKEGYDFKTDFFPTIKTLSKELSMFKNKSQYFLFNKDENLSGVTRIFVKHWGNCHFHWEGKKYILK